MSAALAPLVSTEVRLHRRHHVVTATAIMAAVWLPLLVALPAGWRSEALAWILLLDLATLGLYYAPALAVVERANGVTAALRLTRLSPARAVTLRALTLTAWAVAAAVVLLVVVRPARWPVVFVGVATTSVLFALLAMVMVGRATTLTAYLARVPLVAAPLFLPALLRGIDLVESPWLALSPVTGALELLHGRSPLLPSVALFAAIAVLWVLAVRIGFDVEPTSSTSAGDWPPVRRTAGPSWWRASRSFAATDARTMASDRLLLLVLAGIPVVAVVVRLAAGPGIDWLAEQHGVDAAAHVPVMWAFVLALHVPVMVGTLTGLLFLEDRDAGLLPVLATTRASLTTLFGYRLAVTAVVAAVFVVVSMAIAGAVHEAGWAGIAGTAVAGAAVSAVPATLLATLAQDRVQGTALMKVMGLPLYAPIAWWFVVGPVGWLFALVPTGWAARAFWSTSVLEAAAYALGAIATSALVAGLLLRRLRRSLAA